MNTPALLDLLQSPSGAYLLGLLAGIVIIAGLSLTPAGAPDEPTWIRAEDARRIRAAAERAARLDHAIAARARRNPYRAGHAAWSIWQDEYSELRANLKRKQ